MMPTNHLFNPHVAGRAAALLSGAVLLLVLFTLSACPGDPEKETAGQAPPPAEEPEQPVQPIENDSPVTDMTGLGLEDFADEVIADFNSVWSGLFDDNGRTYSEPALFWFDGTIAAVCDFEQPASGAFYCPADATLYLDRQYVEALRRADPATGELAAAYAIAHHLGHHIQNVLTYTQEVENMRAGLSEEKSADLTLRFELQADFFAGMWMHHAGLLPAEVTEDSVAALLATVATVAEQRVSSGLYDFEPDPLTHGTAEQRQYWLWRGFDTGDIAFASTFAADKL